VQKLTFRYTVKGGGRSAGWRKFHPAEFHEFHFSTNYESDKMKGMRWARHVARMGESTDACRILMGSPK
jgi:hypothetical protein